MIDSRFGLKFLYLGSRFFIDTLLGGAPVDVPDFTNGKWMWQKEDWTP